MRPFILILMGMLFMVACTKTTKVGPHINSDDMPDVSIANLESKYNSDEKLRAKIVSPLANSFSSKQDPYIEFPIGLNIYFYNDSSIVESSMKSDYAIYYTTKRIWEARGNVVVTNSKGSKLTTEQLFGDENSQKIYTTKYVKITDIDGTEIEGKGGFESNAGFSVYKFKDVSGIIPFYAVEANKNSF